MSLVRNKNTKPELRVRSLVHRLGFRFRLHDPHLPGTPDLVFKKLKKVLFVHGCFWHRHAGCPRNRTPKSRLGFWVPKLEQNRKRDRVHTKLLRKLGWDVAIIWECETENEPLLKRKLTRFLAPC